MKTKLLNKWTAALRSREYPQGAGLLRNDYNEFCCIGVLHDVAGKEKGLPYDEIWGDQDSNGQGIPMSAIHNGKNQSAELMVGAELRELEMSHSVQSTLTGLNDARGLGDEFINTFEVIADWIDAHRERFIQYHVPCEENESKS